MAIESLQSSVRGDAARPGQGSRRSSLIFDQLQRDIVLGSLAPRASLLELEVAERFGCSQSTVREALLQLHEGGLVVRLPHRGTTVADCTFDDVVELIRLRHDIECRGISRVLQRYDRLLRKALLDDVGQMHAAAAAGDEYQLSLHDRSFHMRLYAAANLPSVQPILQRCLVHNHRFKILNSDETRDLVETAERHVAIMDALDTGDRSKASAALSHHITTIVDLGPNLISVASPERAGGA